MLFQTSWPFSKTLSRQRWCSAPVCWPRLDTTQSLTERLAYKGAVTVLPELNENLVLCMYIKVSTRFHYALHYPEGEDCASNAMCP